MSKKMTRNDLKKELCGPQEELYKKFMEIMKANPRSVRSYAQDIGISSHTLWKFVRQEGELGFAAACKIKNFIIGKEKGES